MLKMGHFSVLLVGCLAMLWSHDICYRYKRSGAYDVPVWQVGCLSPDRHTDRDFMHCKIKYMFYICSKFLMIILKL